MNLAAILFLLMSWASAAQLKPVAFVDVWRYRGDWYIIGSAPGALRSDCVCGRIRYDVLVDNDIEILSTCNIDRPQGKRATSTAIAEITYPAQSRWWVSYYWRLWWEQYWIVWLDKEYEYAAATNSKGEYLTLMARNPVISQEKLAEIMIDLMIKGIDVSKMSFMRHVGCSYPR